MFEFFFAFGVLFWALVCVLVLGAMVCIENKKYGATFAVVVATMVIIAVAAVRNGYDVWGWIRAHPEDIIKWIAVYLAVGAIYGVARYLLFMRGVATKFREWRHVNNYDKMSAITAGSARSFANHAGIKNFPMRVRDYKGMILFWMSYWPLSLPWTIINHPVMRFFNFVYTRLSGVLQTITDRSFGNIEIVPDNK